jgi:flagellar hook-associated protein 3 FlgL
LKINTSMFSLPASYTGIAKLQDQLTDLQAQLSSGQKAQTLADMGSSRFTDLTVRSQLTRIGAYDTNINTVNLRLNTMNSVLTSLATVASTAKASVTSGVYGTNNINLATQPSIAGAQLDQVLSSLNTDLNGHYLFGGGATDHAPVASTDVVMNGSGALAGFKTVAAQRLQADQGADGLGRLSLGTAADTTTITEDNAPPFGFKLASLSSSSTAATLTQPTGTPASASVQFASQPVAGDTVTLGLKQPDGTTKSITLTAVSGTPAKPGEFQIGADTSATGANFQATLTTSLKTAGSTTLAAASNVAAAANFFNGQGTTVQRAAIDTTTNTYYASTGYETPAQTAADTVQWYTGEDSNGAARTSVTTKVDDQTNVSYGAEANEDGPVKLIRALAVQSIQTYPTTDDTTTATSQARYDAIANSQLSLLSSAHDSSPGSLVSIGVDLGLTQSTLKNLSAQHTAYAAQLQDVLSTAETADPTEIASALLALQTRLSASFTATAMVSQLQLANYLK